MIDTPTTENAVVAWPKSGPLKDTPSRVERPCDYWLNRALHYLEVELGTIETHNRLVECAEKLRDKIERGNAKAQHPICATDPRGLHEGKGIYPDPEEWGTTL